MGPSESENLAKLFSITRAELVGMFNAKLASIAAARAAVESVQSPADVAKEFDEVRKSRLQHLAQMERQTAFHRDHLGSFTEAAVTAQQLQDVMFALEPQPPEDLDALFKEAEYIKRCACETNQKYAGEALQRRDLAGVVGRALRW